MKIFKIGTISEEKIARKETLVTLVRGEIIIFPTETVYGVGVDSENAAAIKKLYKLKGRPEGKPFQWLVHDAKIAKAGSLQWGEQAEKLARAFWPGPLTLVMPAKDGTMGWRVPKQSWLLGLLKEWGRPLTATSANISGEPPPKDLSTAIKPFSQEAGVAVDGGEIGEGPASTVVILDGDHIRILRQGAISEEDISRILK